MNELTNEHSTKTSFAARVHRARLSSGPTLLVVENAASPTIALCGSLRAGSFFEPREKYGLACLTAEMLERGSERRSKLEIANALETAGAEIEFSAGAFAVQIGGRALAEDVPLLLTTLAEMLRAPSFPADELEKLKQQTIADLQEQQTNTRWRAYACLTQLLYDSTHPLHQPDGERMIESIAAITAEDVRRFYAEHYGGGSLILSLVGQVEAMMAEELFRTAFSDFAGPQAATDIAVADSAPQTDRQREIVVIKDKANVDIVLGAAAPLRRATDDYYAAVLANSALGQSTLSSRLGLVVRDREGLTYGIGSRFRDAGLAAGPWCIAVSVNPQNVARAIDASLEVLRDYVEHGITADELAGEKSAATGSFKVSLATNAGIAEALWNAEFYDLGADYPDRFPHLIARITKEEVDHAIKKYFRPDHLAHVIAGAYQDNALD